MPVLICKDVIFYSQQDEVFFFSWLRMINCISEIKGVGREIHLTVPRRKISDANFRELRALFKRYEINKKQLAQFKDR